MVRVKARYAIPAVAAGVTLLVALFPNLDFFGEGSQAFTLGGLAFVFVLITLLGASAVFSRHLIARRPYMRRPPPPTDPRVPMVLHNKTDPEGVAPRSRPATPDRTSRVGVPATPEYGRVLRLLASVPERAVSTSTATALTDLPAERLVPLLADLTRARLVERDAVADLWRVTEHGRNV